MRAVALRMVATLILIQIHMYILSNIINLFLALPRAISQHMKPNLVIDIVLVRCSFFGLSFKSLRFSQRQSHNTLNSK